MNFSSIYIHFYDIFAVPCEKQSVLCGKNMIKITSYFYCVTL